MFERPDRGERSLLVHIDWRGDADPDREQEFAELALAAGAEVVADTTVRIRTPDPRHLLGAGRVAEIAEQIAEQAIDVVLVDHALSPGQERNLERAWQARVLSRTGLILDIFAQRARSFEGRLQVELAQLKHLSTRLIRGWTHLERQKGGIGLRGPGETQLETDRRLLGQRVRVLEQRLQRIENQRQQSRRTRARAEVPTVGLVGYTNAGKSHLFNTLTEAQAYSADQLFATLDPTLRRWDLPRFGHAVMCDTVGFVRDLPHDLVAAFRSTLQEAIDAEVLLHVVDAAALDDRIERIAEVEKVLHEIGAGELPMLTVMNKIDLLDDSEPRLDRDQDGRPVRVWLSALSGAGIDLLEQAVVELLAGLTRQTRLRLEPRHGRFRSHLFAVDAIDAEKPLTDGGSILTVTMPPARLRALLSDSGEGVVVLGKKDDDAAPVALAGSTGGSADQTATTRLHNVS